MCVHIHTRIHIHIHLTRHTNHGYCQIMQRY